MVINLVMKIKNKCRKYYHIDLLNNKIAPTKESLLGIKNRTLCGTFFIYLSTIKELLHL